MPLLRSSTLPLALLVGLSLPAGRPAGAAVATHAPARAAGDPAPASGRDFVFPVARRGLGSVVGRFGDPRDGGRRRHRGIDIAAPHGTPVLAVRDGSIERVERTRAGGLVIWLREAGAGRLHYYAHLSAAHVRRGERVRAGTPIGAVGNSGNASRTPPHLHYSVHVGRDVLDPLRLLAPSPHGGTALAAAAAGGGRTARTRLSGAALKSAAGAGRTLAVLPRDQRVEVLRESGRYVRVRFRDQEGYVARWLLE